MAQLIGKDDTISAPSKCEVCGADVFVNEAKGRVWEWCYVGNAMAGDGHAERREHNCIRPQPWT